MCYSNEIFIQVLGFLFVWGVGLGWGGGRGCLLDFFIGGRGGWGAVNMNSSMNKIKSSPY